MLWNFLSLFSFICATELIFGSQLICKTDLAPEPKMGIFGGNCELSQDVSLCMILAKKAILQKWKSESVPTFETWLTYSYTYLWLQLCIHLFCVQHVWLVLSSPCLWLLCLTVFQGSSGNTSQLCWKMTLKKTCKTVPVRGANTETWMWLDFCFVCHWPISAGQNLAARGNMKRQLAFRLQTVLCNRHSYELSLIGPFNLSDSVQWGPKVWGHFDKLAFTCHLILEINTKVLKFLQRKDLIGNM